jgi:hypothetical protein
LSGSYHFIDAMAARYFSSCHRGTPCYESLLSHTAILIDECRG